MVWSCVLLHVIFARGASGQIIIIIILYFAQCEAAQCANPLLRRYSSVSCDNVVYLPGAMAAPAGFGKLSHFSPHLLLLLFPLAPQII